MLAICNAHGQFKLLINNAAQRNTGKLSGSNLLTIRQALKNYHRVSLQKR